MAVSTFVGEYATDWGPIFAAIVPRRCPCWSSSSSPTDAPRRRSPRSGRETRTEQEGADHGAHEGADDTRPVATA